MRPPVWDLQRRLKGSDRGLKPKRLPTINSNANLFQWVKKPAEMIRALVEAGKNIKNAVVKQINK
jgi:hypothetical protein